jgi:hypothetical protein
MNDDVTLHQKIEGRRGNKRKKAKKIAVFLDFAKVNFFFLLQILILHFGKCWVCQVSFKKEFLN